MADFLPPINKINISYLWKFFIIRLQAVKIILVCSLISWMKATAT